MAYSSRGHGPRSDVNLGGGRVGKIEMRKGIVVKLSWQPRLDKCQFNNNDVFYMSLKAVPSKN